MDIPSSAAKQAKPLPVGTTNWYIACLTKAMSVEPRKHKSAQEIFLFSASALCAMLLCMAAIAWHNAPAPHLAGSPIYMYQNPFKGAAHASAAAFSGAKMPGIWQRLISAKFFLGLSGLGVLWLASTWYLEHVERIKQRVYQEVNHAAPPSPAKMNSLAILPEPAALRVPKEDNFHTTVFCGKTALCSLARRKNPAPCQSRFRPVTLGSRQTRFGRL